MENLRVLHLTHHWGAYRVIESNVKSLGFGIETQSGIQQWNYNIGHIRAEELWNKYKDYYNKFDVIIVSDTPPLSRIFIQNNYSGKLIVWVTIRFDYYDSATNDCGFPDREYYDLIRAATQNPKVKFIPSYDFESIYAKKYRNVDFTNEVIYPWAPNVNIGSILPKYKHAVLPPMDKDNTLFVLNNHNDKLFHVEERCQQLGMPAYRSDYDTFDDLVGFKALVHVPYSFGKVAMFDYLELGQVFLTPTKEFLLELSKTPGFWYDTQVMSPSSAVGQFIETSNWYLPKYNDLFIRFCSWEHLAELAKNEELIKEKREYASKFVPIQIQETLEKWRKAIVEWK
jgi:hypothetical protein